MSAAMPIERRFWAKVNDPLPDKCWEWKGYVSSDGYGTMRIGSRTDGTRKTIRAHRLSYELFIGPIPAGMVLDHLCRNRSCVNPAHLEPVTNAENVRRGEGATYWRLKTKCPQGHPYDEQNTIRRQGSRSCRQCGRNRSLAHYHSDPANRAKARDRMRAIRAAKAA